MLVIAAVFAVLAADPAPDPAGGVASDVGVAPDVADGGSCWAPGAGAVSVPVEPDAGVADDESC